MYLPIIKEKGISKIKIKDDTTYPNLSNSSLGNILHVPDNPITVQEGESKRVTFNHILTSAEFIQQLSEKNEEKKRKAQEKDDRKQQRELKKTENTKKQQEQAVNKQKKKDGEAFCSKTSGKSPCVKQGRECTKSCTCKGRCCESNIIIQPSSPSTTV